MASGLVKYAPTTPIGPHTSQAPWLAPAHPPTLHLSFSDMVFPAPRQLEQADWICCTIPGPICRSWICTPRPVGLVSLVGRGRMDGVG